MVTRTSYLASRATAMPEDQSYRFRAHRQRVGCQLLCRILGVHVQIRGRLPERKGMLVVSNHFGVLDPLILASVIPVSFVGKAELKDWPFIGWVAITHGLLLVDRQRRTTVAQFARQVKERLDSGVHVLVFPEGTTSPDDELLPFKTGAFEAVADRQDAYVLPVHLAVDTIEGEPAVGEVRKRVVWSNPDLPFLEHAREVAGIRSMKFTVSIGDPIATDGRDRKALAQVAQEAVQGLYTARKQTSTPPASQPSITDHE